MFKTLLGDLHPGPKAVFADPVVARSSFCVDGDHGYESFRRELLGSIMHVQQASLLLHDTFSQTAESGYNVSTSLTIRDILAEHPGRFRVYEQNLSLPGMTFRWRQDAR